MNESEQKHLGAAPHGVGVRPIRAVNGLKGFKASAELAREPRVRAAYMGI